MKSWISFGAGALGAAVGVGCHGDQCASSDLDCFLAHMVIVDRTGSTSPVSLTPLGKSTLPPNGSSTTCTASVCNGVCVTLAVDPANCGTCGHACAVGERCAQGSCACPGGTSSCAAGCVDLQSNPQNCGVCGTSCDAGYCSEGACVSSCGVGRVACDNGCVDTQSDPRNCGACGHTCTTGQTCEAGVCACTSPTATCGCVDLATDAANCGACGTVCSSGQTCSGGACGGGVAAPSITNQPGPIQISAPSELQDLELDFDDPQGCAPAFCAHLCDTKLRCSSGFMCTRPKRDQQTQGVWRSYLGFLAEPTDEAAQFTTGFVPVSAPGCPDDLLDQLASGAIADVGVGVEVQVAVTVALPSSSGGGDDEGSCSPSVSTCSCSVVACADSSGSCWYEVGGSRIDCSGCDCTSAAQSIVSQCCPTP